MGLLIPLLFGVKLKHLANFKPLQNIMQYRKFGQTDLLVSETGFGAWAIGGGAMVGQTPIGWGDADDATSLKAIHAAMDAGINFFDTADIYGLGHSEDLLGRTLGNRADAIIATKVGNVARGGLFAVDYSAQHIIEACEASLRRLKREAIDYYQLHTARMAHLQQGACIEAMERLRQQGKVRWWGLSLNTFYPAAEAEYMMENQWGHGFQLVWNLINQRAADTLQRAAAQGYGIIARMPLQFGLLTGKFGRGAGFGANDHRSNRFAPHILQACLDVLEKEVWLLGDAQGIGPTALAMRFATGTQGVSTVIPGIRTPQQVGQNSGPWPALPPALMQRLLQLADSHWQPVMELIEKQG
jgi:aryl-alcohol dehydrogenase-like predicted oxidoreductase